MTAPTDFTIVPAGALCGVSVALTCKGQNEDRSYVIEYDTQLSPDDYIIGPITWSAGDDALNLTNVTPYGRRFSFTASGGTLNQKSGIKFVLPLKSGDIRTLVCVITIEEQGVLQTGNIPVVMGAQGARGTQIWFSESDPTSNFEPPDGTAVNPGDIVYSQATNAFWTASYIGNVLTWTKTAAFVTTADGNSVINNTTLGAIADDAILSKSVTDFFQIINGRLCLMRSKLHVTPTQDGEIYDPGQGILYINYED